MRDLIHHPHIHKIHRHITAYGCFLIMVGCLILVGINGGFLPYSKGTGSAAPCTVDAKLVNSCRPWIGAAVGGYSMVGSDALSQFNFANKRLNNPNVLTNPSAATTVTKHLDIIHTYHTLDNTNFSAVENSFMSQANTYLFINYKPDLVWANATGGNATVNARIDALANTFKSKPSNKFFLAIFHEPENDVSSGNCAANANGASAGSPTDYVNMWRNVRARFDAKGVNNVVWVMNYMGYSGWNCLVPMLWPGNNYVDWILYDPYASGSGSNANFTNSMTNMYNYMTDHSNSTQNYLSKPWGLAEHGAIDMTQQRAIDYWTQGATAINNNSLPLLKMFVAFDTTTNGTSMVGLDFSNNANIAEQTAFNTFADAIFAKQSTTPTPGDTVNPSVSITSPANSVSVNGTITIDVTATDNVAITKVDIFWDGTNIIRSGTSQGTYGWGSRWNTASAPDGAHTLKAVAYDAAGNSSTSQISITVQNNTPTPLAPIINSFSRNPASVTVGSKSTLSWSSTNATTCSVNPGGLQNTTATTWQTLAFAGTGTYTFTLICKNSANVTVSATTTVEVTAAVSPPSNVTLSASSTNIQQGGQVLLSWSSVGSSTCTLNPGNHSANGTSSSKTVTNIQATTTYKVTCQNSAGSAESPARTVTVSSTPPVVADPEITSIGVSPIDVAYGGVSTISWTSSDTTACSLMPSPLTSAGSNGEWTSGALTASVTYTLTCVNSAGKSVSESVSITVNGQAAPAAPAATLPSVQTISDTADGGLMSSPTGAAVTYGQSAESVTIGELLTLDAGNISDAAKIGTIERVEFYVDEFLVTTIEEEPFALDTSGIEPGIHNVTQRTYYADGSSSEQSQVLTFVLSDAARGISPSKGMSKLALGAVIGSSLVVLAGVGFSYWWFVNKKRNGGHNIAEVLRSQHKEANSPQPYAPPQPVDTEQTAALLAQLYPEKSLFPEGTAPGSVIQPKEPPKEL